MHQGHHIPWNVISANFKFIKEDKRFTPPFTGIVSKRNSGAPGEIKHFVNKLIMAIRAFSDTERRKYPDQLVPLTSGKLFSDELLEKYPEYLNGRNQRIEHWIERATDHPHFPFHYDTSHGDLADVVKVLLYENKLEALLMLAQHPSIPLGNLHNLSWGHHFGFSRVGESAIRAYLYFNSAEAIGILESGEYALSPGYHSLLLEISGSMDFPAQQIPHQKFLRECGIPPEYISYSGKDLAKRCLVHTDYKRLQSYLKDLFALMYRYDVLVRECGSSPEWEGELSHTEPIRHHTKLDYVDGEYKVIYV